MSIGVVLCTVRLMDGGVVPPSVGGDGGGGGVTGDLKKGARRNLFNISAVEPGIKLDQDSSRDT